MFQLSTIPFRLCLAAVVGSLVTLQCLAQEAASQAEDKLYELRLYTTNPDKLPDLQARFRDHTMGLFEKHGMENIIAWHGHGQVLEYHRQ